MCLKFTVRFSACLYPKLKSNSLTGSEQGTQPSYLWKLAVRLRHLSLEACPNPFRGQVSLQLTARAGAGACPYRPEVRIYDVNGALVRSFSQFAVRSPQFESPRSLLWDGTDNLGRRLPAGVYVVRLTDGANNVNRKVMLLR